MKRIIASLIVCALVLTNARCSWGVFSQGATARDSAAKALNMTTQSAVALMTIAGVAYDAGVWGAPGSPRAEDTWGKLSAESVRLSTALTAWADALEAGKDTGPYQLVVATALAVIAALLPPRQKAGLELYDDHALPVTDASRRVWTFALAAPDTFRRHEVAFGGSR